MRSDEHNLSDAIARLRSALGQMPDGDDLLDAFRSLVAIEDGVRCLMGVNSVAAYQIHDAGELIRAIRRGQRVEMNAKGNGRADSGWSARMDRSMVARNPLNWMESFDFRAFAATDAADEIERLRAALAEVTAERDAALAALAPHEALVAELRERAAVGQGTAVEFIESVYAPVLLARHGLGGDA